MAKHPIDKIFNKQLKNHEIKPNAEIWDKLNLMLDRQQGKITHKKGFVWMSVAASLTIILLSIALWNYYTPFKENPREIAAKNKKMLIPKKENTVEKNIGIDDKKLSPHTKKDNKSDNSPNILEDDVKQQLTKNQQNQKRIFEKNKKTNSDKIKEMPVLDFELKDKEEKIAQKQEQNTEEESYTLKVTVKLSGKNKETLVADNTGTKPKNKAGKVFRQLKNLKNGEGEPVKFKIFGIPEDELWAYIGKDK